MWGWLEKAVEWMGEHKLATGAIAAGVGAVVVTKVANAAPAVITNPNLPGTKNVQQIQGGGLATPTHVIPPPHPSAQGATFYVTTQDPAPGGNLNARATDEIDAQGKPTGAVIGYWAKDEPVQVLDPGPGNGMVYVRGAGIDDTTHAAVQLEAWASSAYLAKRDNVSDILSAATGFPMEF